MKRLALTLALLSALLMGNAFIPQTGKLRVPFGSCNQYGGCWVEFKPQFGAAYPVTLRPNTLLWTCQCFVIPDRRFAGRYRLVDPWGQRSPLADTSLAGPAPAAGCTPPTWTSSVCSVEE